MSSITIDNLNKTFGKSVVAVKDLSLRIADGEFFVLVGPSGSGKTTVLRILAGLEEPDSGSVFLDDDDVTSLHPRNRDIAMVFQNYALYPHMQVRDNIAFGLRRRKVPRPETERKVGQVAAMLELQDLLSRRPAQLSGGQRQRVALGRAIAREPRAFLMDEPLSNLDANLRVSMRVALAQLRERLRTTTVYITHDQVEAMTLGNRVGVMREGVLEQVDTPKVLYEEPANLFVAAFIGSPRINLVEAVVEDSHVRIGDARVPLGHLLPVGHRPGTKLIVGIRPFDLEDEAFSPNPSFPRLTARIAVREDLGSELQVLFPVSAAAVERAEVSSALEGAEFAELDLAAGSRRPMFAAQISARSSARIGYTIRLVIDPGRVYLFDAETTRLIAGPADSPAAEAGSRPTVLPD